MIAKLFKTILKSLIVITLSRIESLHYFAPLKFGVSHNNLNGLQHEVKQIGDNIHTMHMATFYSKFPLRCIHMF